MTENYYMVQQLLPFYFSNPTNRDFFYNTISRTPDNMKIFIEKELYGWVKDDFYRQKVNDKKAVVPEEERVWKYNPTQIEGMITDNKEWIVIFVKFPPDFVNENLDSISVAIAMKNNSDNSIEIRLFMLETGKDYNGDPAVYVCGRNISDGKHNNFGTINFDEKFMTTFIDKVIYALKNNL